MRVIAKAGTRKYLLEAESEEVDLIAGRQVCRGSYGDERQIEYVVGTTFNIVEAFNQIHRNDRRRAQVKNLRETLTAMLTGLDMIDPLIDEPKPEPPAEPQL